MNEKLKYLTLFVIGMMLSLGMNADVYKRQGYGTAIPSGWLIALPYLRNNAHVRLIVPSKMGHTTAQQYVNPCLLYTSRCV